MNAIDKIMKLVKVSTDKELSIALGHRNPSTVGNWRRRGVPNKVLREWEIKYNKRKSVQKCTFSISSQKAPWPEVCQDH